MERRKVGNNDSDEFPQKMFIISAIIFDTLVHGKLLAIEVTRVFSCHECEEGNQSPPLGRKWNAHRPEEEHIQAWPPANSFRSL